jgi:hypothetical protein
VAVHGAQSSSLHALAHQQTAARGALAAPAISPAALRPHLPLCPPPPCRAQPKVPKPARRRPARKAVAPADKRRSDRVRQLPAPDYGDIDQADRTLALLRWARRLAMLDEEYRGQGAASAKPSATPP